MWTRFLSFLCALCALVVPTSAQWHEDAWETANWNSRALVMTNMFAVSNWFAITNWVSYTNRVISTQEFFTRIGPEDTTTQIFVDVSTWALQRPNTGTTQLENWTYAATTFAPRSSHAFALNAEQIRDLDLYFAIRERGLAVGDSNAPATRFYRSHISNGVTQRQKLFDLIPAYVDTTRTGADGTFNAWFTNVWIDYVTNELGITTNISRPWGFPFWSNAVHFCQTNYMPTNLLDMISLGSGEAQLVFSREYPGVPKIVTNHWAIQPSAGVSTSSTPWRYTNTVLGTWGETNVLVGTNKQPFTTYSTNEWMVDQTTTFDYGASVIRRVVSRLVWSQPENLIWTVETNSALEYSLWQVRAHDFDDPAWDTFATVKGYVQSVFEPPTPGDYFNSSNNTPHMTPGTEGGYWIGTATIRSFEAGGYGAAMSYGLLYPFETNHPVYFHWDLSNTAMRVPASCDVYFVSAVMSNYSAEYYGPYRYWVQNLWPLDHIEEDTWEPNGVALLQSTNPVLQASVAYTGTNWTWYTGNADPSSLSWAGVPTVDELLYNNSQRARGVTYGSPFTLFKFDLGTGSNAWIFK